MRSTHDLLYKFIGQRPKRPISIPSTIDTQNLTVLVTDAVRSFSLSIPSLQIFPVAINKNQIL